MNDFFDPFQRMKKMQEKRMNWLGDFPVLDSPSEARIREPLIDIRDEGNKLKIVAEMPGVDKKDIEIDLGDNSISISAASKTDTEEKDAEKGSYYSERSFQSFSRTIPLPAEIKRDGAEAELKNGILEITLEKKHPEERKGNKRLEVK